MTKDFAIQACLALLVGAGVFYITAPHSWGLGIFIQEPIYAALSLAISQAILIPSILFFFKKKQKHLVSTFLFSFIGIVLMVFLYPSSKRLTLPSDSIREDIKASLHKKTDMPADLRIRVGYRTKQLFDFFAEHKWTVRISGNDPLKHKTLTYIERFGHGVLIISEEVNWSELNNRKPQ